MSLDMGIITPEGSKIQKTTEKVRILGIDLGTTNSTVAEIVWDSKSHVSVRCIPVEQNTQSGLYTHLIVPSAIALYQDQVWIGEGAKRLHARAPEFGLEISKSLFLECKNDIGSRRTYHKAPDGYRSPVDIGAKVLNFLKQAAEQQDDMPIKKTVVTVPASFQAAQRLDTVQAAKNAGIEICSGDLLDEPVAAFLDYIMSYRDKAKGLLSEPQNLLVFDFGGGTCDVAIFRIGEGAKARLQISPLSVSRYHRLGGGDIDRAILYEILIPQLIDQNEIDVNSLTFEEKKNIIEPSFIGIAEALKIGLCNLITRSKKFGNYDESAKAGMRKTQPGLHTCKVRNTVLKLTAPSLSVDQFEEVLKPFLDSDFQYPKETEYFLTCSIFAPLSDALDRCNLEPKNIDLCLLVGGSSLIPQIQESVSEYLNRARILTFPDNDAVQTATARGAAAHALAIALYGKSVFQVVANDRLSIKTSSSSYELVPKGAQLPYPADGWRCTSELAVPASSIIKPVPLLVEILAGNATEERPLMRAAWEIIAPVNKGEKLRLEYRLDENQVLELRLWLENRQDEEPFICKLENPLSNVVNPNAIRLRINEMEENLRTGAYPNDDITEKIVEIAKDYSEINQTEKAISYLKQALRRGKSPDPYVLNLLGIYHGELGDYDGQEKFYREAAQYGAKETALFNLALAQKGRKRFTEAQQTIKERNDSESCGPGLTLAAQIEENLNNNKTRDAFLEDALAEFSSISAADDWELGWIITAARMAGKKDLLQDAQAEQRRRKHSTNQDDSVSGMLPEMTGALRRMDI